jgi:hypothetical protein
VSKHGGLSDQQHRDQSDTQQRLALTTLLEEEENFEGADAPAQLHYYEVAELYFLIMQNIGPKKN